jgi:hypothetical protein
MESALAGWRMPVLEVVIAGEMKKPVRINNLSDDDF